jgi:hypothetical protein
MLHLLQKWRVLCAASIREVSWLIVFIAGVFACENLRREFQVNMSILAPTLSIHNRVHMHQLTFAISRRRDDQGCTPLHTAAARNRGAVVNELLKFGAGLLG